MSYEKQTWAKGDIVTSAKLNYMEDGIAGGSGVLVVDSVHDEQTEETKLDKTWQEIHDATLSVIIGDSPMGKVYIYINAVGTMKGNYNVTAAVLSDDTVQSLNYVCNSADDYPVLQTTE